MHGCNVAQMQCAFMAQNEDDAFQRHHDLHMVMLTKSIESTERFVDLKMKMYNRMGHDGTDTYSLTAINLLVEKLEQLNDDLESMVLEVRLTNPIVGDVLDNAKIVMGLVTPAGSDWLRIKQGGCRSVTRKMIMMKMLARMKILWRQ